MIKMEKLFFFILLSIVFLLIILFFYNCISNGVDGFDNSVIFWLPRSTRNQTRRATVTAPAEIICDQQNISTVEKDQQNQYQRRKSTPMSLKI